MANYLLEETYSDLSESVRSSNQTKLVLLAESPTSEQDWVSKNIIKHIQAAIDNINISRSYIPTFISRNDVRSQAEKLEKVKADFLEIWHNIQDVAGTNHPIGDIPIEINDILEKVKQFGGVINPSIKSPNGQARFDNPEKLKKFVTYLVTSKIKHSVQGNLVNFNV